MTRRQRFGKRVKPAIAPTRNNNDTYTINASPTIPAKAPAEPARRWLAASGSLVSEALSEPPVEVEDTPELPESVWEGASDSSSDGRASASSVVVASDVSLRVAVAA